MTTLKDDEKIKGRGLKEKVHLISIRVCWTKKKRRRRSKCIATGQTSSSCLKIWSKSEHFLLTAAEDKTQFLLLRVHAQCFHLNAATLSDSSKPLTSKSSVGDLLMKMKDKEQWWAASLYKNSLWRCIVHQNESRIVSLGTLTVVNDPSEHRFQSDCECKIWGSCEPSPCQSHKAAMMQAWLCVVQPLADLWLSLFQPASFSSQLWFHWNTRLSLSRRDFHKPVASLSCFAHFLFLFFHAIRVGLCSNALISKCLGGQAVFY